MPSAIPRISMIFLALSLPSAGCVVNGKRIGVESLSGSSSEPTKAPEAQEAQPSATTAAAPQAAPATKNPSYELSRAANQSSLLREVVGRDAETWRAQILVQEWGQRGDLEKFVARCEAGDFNGGTYNKKSGEALCEGLKDWEPKAREIIGAYLPTVIAENVKSSKSGLEAAIASASKKDGGWIDFRTLSSAYSDIGEYLRALKKSQLKKYVDFLGDEKVDAAIDAEVKWFADGRKKLGSTVKKRRDSKVRNAAPAATKKFKFFFTWWGFKDLSLKPSAIASAKNGKMEVFHNSLGQPRGRSQYYRLLTRVKGLDFCLEFKGEEFFKYAGGKFERQAAKDAFTTGNRAKMVRCK